MSFTKRPDTAARFTHLAGQLLTDEHGQPLVNDIIEKDTGAILRFRNGYLDGGELPAVECDDSHMEFYKNGQLHREAGPAVLSNYGKLKEYWRNGRRVSLPRTKRTSK
jgi:hypothetical protein